MQITVDKLEVLNDVKREVEYSGAKDGDYDHMRIIDADDELLRRWMSDALKSIENELRELRKDSVMAGNTWYMNTTHNNNMDGWASVSAQSYVEAKVLVEWFMKVNVMALVEYYNARAESHMAELKKLAYHRTIS